MLETIFCICLTILITAILISSIKDFFRKKSLVWTQIGDNLYIAPIFGHQKWFVIHNEYVKNNSITLYLESYSGKMNICYSDLIDIKSSADLVIFIENYKKFAESVSKSF